MDNISEICKLPCYVFDKGLILGEVAASSENLSSKNYCIHLIRSGFETEGLLEGAYWPPNIQPETGREITQLAAIGHDADGLFVAKDNYFSNLIAYFFSRNDQNVREGTFPQCGQDWSSIFSKEIYTQSYCNIESES